MVRRFGWFAVLVGAQHREVERPPWKLKIVRIPAERRDISFRREHQPHVVIALVLVDEVLASLVHCDGLAFELARLRLGARLFAGLLEYGEHFLARLIGGFVVPVLYRFGYCGRV